MRGKWSELIKEGPRDANRILLPQSVVNELIADNAITTAKIAAGAVGTTDIADDAVTAAKIAADAVGSSEIAADAVGSSEIAANAVGSAEIASGAVGTDELDADIETWIQAGWGTWRVFKDFGTSYLSLDATSAEYIFLESTAAFSTTAFSSWNTPLKQVRLVSSDFPSVTGKTLKFRLRGWANTNNTNPTLNIDLKMKSFTTAGAADVMATTLGAQVGNTCTLTDANLSASANITAVSTAFTCPADAHYTVTVTTDDTLDNNAVIHVGARIDYCWQ